MMSKQWNGPMPSAELDALVYAAFRGNARSRWWIPIAAAAAGVVVVAGFWMRRPVEIEIDSEVFSTPSVTTFETQLGVSGFQPIRDARFVTAKETEQ
jgi:hypothetical protein